MRKKILTIFGTRPEAIKMAPIINLLRTDDRFLSKVCVTGQHREMLDQVLKLFKIIPDYDLNLMKKNQSIDKILADIILGLSPIIDEYHPDIVLVHGDTITSFGASMASFLKKVKVGHVEAGLRTGDIYSPWPEEGNRKLTAVVSNIHFAPTKKSKENLLNESYSNSSIHVTGNTVIDALFFALNEIKTDRVLKNKLDNEFNYLRKKSRKILVTAHRRESFGAGIKNICNALKEIAIRNPELDIIYPVHPNPNISKTVHNTLSKISNIYLIKPLEYIQFVYLMKESHIIMTDSGGIQEEAPSLGKPVLVLRKLTERPEAVNAGCISLIGTDKNNIINKTQELITSKTKYTKMSQAQNPFGDGNASSRIIKILNNEA